jgi:hypothetical protein
VLTQIKCKDFFTLPQSHNRSDVGRGDNSIGKNYACSKIP